MLFEEQDREGIEKKGRRFWKRRRRVNGPRASRRGFRSGAAGGPCPSSSSRSSPLFSSSCIPFPSPLFPASSLRDRKAKFATLRLVRRPNPLPTPSLFSLFWCRPNPLPAPRMRFPAEESACAPSSSPAAGCRPGLRSFVGWAFFARPPAWDAVLGSPPCARASRLPGEGAGGCALAVLARCCALCRRRGVCASARESRARRRPCGYACTPQRRAGIKEPPYGSVRISSSRAPPRIS